MPKAAVDPYDGIGVHISSIRQKLGPRPVPRRIQSVRGLGPVDRRMMKPSRLFWKLFLAFWLATSLTFLVGLGIRGGQPGPQGPSSGS